MNNRLFNLGLLLVQSLAFGQCGATIVVVGHFPASLLKISMTDETESKIQDSNLSTAELISHFREKCKVCGHHRIMHNELGVCEGVMNKPCTSGCDKFETE